MRRFFWLCLVLSGCGGGGGGGSAPAPVQNSSPPGANVISVSFAPSQVNVNILLANITVCTPNTSNCQVIPNLLVDTGSYGIRVLKSALPVALSGETGQGGNSVAECATFAGGYTWGPVQVADVIIGGEHAYGLPIQVIDDGPTPSFAVPASCNAGLNNIGNTASLGTNGILGIGAFANDCGLFCALSAGNGSYFECSSSCLPAAEPVSLQVKNPVSQFQTDNNGIMLTLPQVPDTGAPGATGSLVFGIGTQSNNSLGTAAVISLDNTGNFKTLFNGHTFPNSFIDSGSNMLFFQGGALPACASNAGYYCPPSTQKLTATAQSSVPTGASATVSFSVGNADSLTRTGNAVFNNIARINTDPTSFDWGIPFFLGRTVYFAINGASTSAGFGPFVAF